MTLKELEDSVLAPMATGFRMLAESMKNVPGLVENESRNANLELAFSQADIKLRELNFWLRDVRGMLVAMTDESKENAAKQLAALEKAQKEAAGVN